MIADGTHDTIVDRREKHTGNRVRTKSLSLGDPRAFNKSVQPRSHPLSPLDRRTDFTSQASRSPRCRSLTSKMSCWSRRTQKAA